MLIYICYLLIKSCNDFNESQKEIEIGWNNIDLLITDEKENIKAFICLTSKDITQEDLNSVNRTLIDNHGLRLYKTKK